MIFASGSIGPVVSSSFVIYFLSWFIGERTRDLLVCLVHWRPSRIFCNVCFARKCDKTRTLRNINSVKHGDQAKKFDWLSETFLNFCKD